MWLISWGPSPKSHSTQFVIARYTCSYSWVHSSCPWTESLVFEAPSSSDSVRILHFQCQLGSLWSTTFPTKLKLGARCEQPQFSTFLPLFAVLDYDTQPDYFAEPVTLSYLSLEAEIWGLRLWLSVRLNSLIQGKSTHCNLSVSLPTSKCHWCLCSEAAKIIS